jgi:hypothetical protein
MKGKNLQKQPKSRLMKGKRRLHLKKQPERKMILLPS